MKTKKTKKLKNTNLTRRIFLILGVIIIFITIICGGAYYYSSYEYNGEVCWIKISGNDNDALNDSLKNKLGDKFGGRVYKLWYLMGGKIQTSQGAYKIEPGMSVFEMSRALKNNYQTPVKIVFNNIRTMDKLAEKVSKNMHFNDTEFLSACDSVLTAEGFKHEEFPAAFLPDSYEFYWNTPAKKVVKKLFSYYDKFWNEQRIAKAKTLGLTPVQISIIASIVEEETNKTDERPLVARLYINRLKKGMKLQADPTVKFAIGNFSLRRINHSHLTVASPYNTYQNIGLPPGPIRIVSKSTLEAVLNAPNHNYIYMCAKEDFSGYHNFAVDYATHLANAKRYQAELNKRNIK